MEAVLKKASLAYFDNAVKLLRARLPAPCVIEHKLVADTKITWRYCGWSSALTWICIEGHVSLDELAGFLALGLRAGGPVPIGIDWADPIVGRGFSTQLERHAAALAHGLSPGGGNDLPAERMLIDRQLKAMLEDSGINLQQAIAKRLQAYWWERDYVRRYSKPKPDFGDCCFTIRHSGLETPVIISTLAVGPAKYDGASLILPGHLPDTICFGSAGRPLGGLVKTGNAMLDRRLIFRVRNDEDYDASYEEYPVTVISLMPDLVEMGPPQNA